MTKNRADRSREQNWWRELTPDPVIARRRTRGDDLEVRVAREELLRSVRPVAFAPTASHDDSVSTCFSELVEQLRAIEAAVDEAADERARVRGASVDAAFHAALESDDAGILLDTGDWAGFTRGRAIGWCWNLYQYEPQGLVMPGLQLRMQRLAELRGGGIPDGFGYAERARTLETNGLTPPAYREAQRALGAPAHPGVYAELL